MRNSRDVLKPAKHVPMPNIEPSNCILTGPTGNAVQPHPGKFYCPPPGFEKVLLLA